MIIGISGYATAGKDTVGAILVQQYGFSRVAFADRLKALAVELDPILAIKGPEHPTFHCSLSQLVDDYTTLDAAKMAVPAVREYLQKLGVACRDKLGEHVWVWAALQDLPKMAAVTDVRFVNEADAIREAGGFVWRVNRPGVAPINGHVSEHALDHYPFDHYVQNDGTIDDLRTVVSALVNSEVLAS